MRGMPGWLVSTHCKQSDHYEASLGSTYRDVAVISAEKYDPVCKAQIICDLLAISDCDSVAIDPLAPLAEHLQGIPCFLD